MLKVLSEFLLRDENYIKRIVYDYLSQNINLQVDKHSFKEMSIDLLISANIGTLDKYEQRRLWK